MVEVSPEDQAIADRLLGITGTAQALSPKDIALIKLRRELSPKEFQMFDLHVAQGLPLIEVGRILDVSPLRVWLAKVRVQIALFRTVRRLKR